MVENKITIEVLYALKDHQYLKHLVIDKGTTAIEAVKKSGIIKYIADYNENELVLGVYSKKINHDYEVQNLDRIEIYRKLIFDPKENRRRRASK